MVACSFRALGSRGRLIEVVLFAVDAYTLKSEAVFYSVVGVGACVRFVHNVVVVWW